MDHRTPREELPGAPGRTPRERPTSGRESEELSHEARERVGEVRDETREYLTRMAEERKTRTVDFMDRVARAMRRTTDSLEEEDVRSMGRYTDEAAERIERASGYLRDHDVRSVMSSTEDFARRRPEIFFGGLAAAGFAVGRFLRSSGRPEGARDRGKPESLPAPEPGPDEPRQATTERPDESWRGHHEQI